MKKIKLLISLVLINFYAYSQTIPEVPINQFTQAGYLNSKYYPIGWSEDERYFALMILSESNYASLPEGHGFDFLVKDVVTDKDAYIKSYNGYDICEGKFDAYGQGECDFSAKGIFELHKATFTEAINKYNINTKTPLAYSTFPIKNAKGESISIQNNKVEKDGYISKETLTATNNQQGSKTILQSTYDSNFGRLASEIVGAFVSPSKERLLVIQKYTSSGIEGDRDIELNFIGCHTQKGYQSANVKVDISDHAYVIATNVNMRNKPNVSKSKVLFQLNKVEWYKDASNFGSESDYIQTDWLSFPATPVEIIDSAITDGNKWYKIKGAKLTKEEASDLSKWGDWDVVRDSLFNLDDNGYIIRENYDGENWIYHTLVHRFQNNSLKDGKYSASKVVEDWMKEIGEKVNFNIDGNDVKGEIEFYSSLYDGVYCKLYGEKSNDGKHLNLKSTCYSEGTEYEGGTYKITLMDNNAFKLTFTNNNRSASSFYRYDFEEKVPINQFNGLVLTEKTFGNLNLDKSTPLSITDLNKAFKTQKITKNLGERDGPSFWYYDIGKLARASTIDTEANTLHQLWIQDTSIPDQFGVTINMTFEELIEKRPNLYISSKHYHIYLYEKGSNIAYKMSIGDDYNGPDRWEYDFEHLKKYNSKIISMGWVIKNN